MVFLLICLMYLLPACWFFMFCLTVFAQIYEICSTKELMSLANHCYNFLLVEVPWWRYQMETFSALLALCAGNSPVNSPHKCQWCGSLMFFFYLRPNKRLSKQWWGWWFETPSRSLWRHCNTSVAIVITASWCYAGIWTSDVIPWSVPWWDPRSEPLPRIQCLWWPNSKLCTQSIVC